MANNDTGQEKDAEQMTTKKAVPVSPLVLDGSPTTVALTILLVAVGGAAIGHILFGAPLSWALVLGAMLPTLVGILVAAYNSFRRGHDENNCRGKR